MKPWLDLPLEQWIYYDQELVQGRPVHKLPWRVFVGNGMIIRARFKHEYQAIILVNRLKSAFDPNVLFIPKPGTVPCDPILTGTPTRKSSKPSRRGSKSSAKKDSGHGKSRKGSASQKQRSTRGSEKRASSKGKRKSNDLS